MLNLHQVASGVTSAVNPQTPLTLLISTGSTPNADATRTPTYDTYDGIFGDVQPLSTGDIRHMDALQIQGVRRAIYITGHVDAIVRISNKGGDMVVTPDDKMWLVHEVAEQWPTWVKVLCTLQNKIYATPAP